MRHELMWDSEVEIGGGAENHALVKIGDQLIRIRVRVKEIASTRHTQLLRTKVIIEEAE